MPTCKLCRRTRKLCESHIVPEFFYRPGYDAKGRMLKIDRRSSSQRQAQSGHTERLLCEDCEQFLNDSYERDFARYWYESGNRPTALESNKATIRDYSYPLFKLHHLSVLWRASVAEADPLHHMDLGPDEEPIRQMLLEGDPGPWTQYGITGAMQLAPEDAEGVREGEVADGPVITPHRAGDGDAHAQYHALFGGVMWMFLVPAVPDDRRYLKPAMVTPDGQMTMPVQKFKENEAVRIVYEEHLERRSEDD